jgi:hypothetical protein
MPIQSHLVRQGSNIFYKTPDTGILRRVTDYTGDVSGLPSVGAVGGISGGDVSLTEAQKMLGEYETAEAARQKAMQQTPEQRLGTVEAYRQGLLPESELTPERKLLLSKAGLYKGDVEQYKTPGMKFREQYGRLPGRAELMTLGVKVPQEITPSTPSAGTKQFYRVGADIYEAGTGRHIGPTEWGRDWTGRATEVSAPSLMPTDMTSARETATTPPITGQATTPVGQAITPVSTTEDLYSQFNKLREQFGLGTAAKTTQTFASAVQDVKTKLDDLEKNINARISGKGLIEAQRQRLLTSEGRPLREELIKLGEGLTAARATEAVGRQTLADYLTFAKMKTKEPVTLKAGESIVDPNTGKVIYTSPSVDDSAKPTSVKEYEYYAKAETNAGKTPLSYDNWMTKDANRKRAISVQQGTTGMTSSQISSFNTIVGKYQASPLVKADDRALVLRSILPQLRSNPTDSSLQISFIYSFIQALDTYQSAVREGEISLLSETQGLADKIRNLPNKIASGSVLSENMINKYIKTAEFLTNSIAVAAGKKKNEFGAQASVSGVGDAWNNYISISGTSSPATKNDSLGIR